MVTWAVFVHDQWMLAGDPEPVTVWPRPLSDRAGSWLSFYRRSVFTAVIMAGKSATLKRKDTKASSGPAFAARTNSSLTNGLLKSSLEETSWQHDYCLEWGHGKSSPRHITSVCNLPRKFFRNFSGLARDRLSRHSKSTSPLGNFYP